MDLVKSKYGLNSFSLKIIACVSMLIDHIAAVIFIVPKSLMMLKNAIQYYEYGRDIGRIAFPIFAFLVVEGFIHTKDIKKYAIRMFGFALFSQIPYNMAFGNMPKYNPTYIFGKYKIFSPAYIFGNVMWSFLLGIILMYLMKEIEKKEIDRIIKYFLFTVLIILFGSIAHYIRCDYRESSVIIIGLFYICRDKRWKQILSTSISFMGLSLYTYLACIPIALYNGKRGPNIKYFFYLFYPVHLLILSLIRDYMFKGA